MVLTCTVVRALVLTALCLLGSGWGSAQTLLADYRRATDALAQSVGVFATDPVASLDALRRAEETFTPLSEGLEPGLGEGLGATFARAEQAIVNESETDLRVQVAVLRGGFGRALYRQALTEAAAGNVARARNLLGVLAGDLDFDRQTFRADTQRTLQAAFERRLAALSLARLGALGEGREARYETLAQLYGYIFLVQDSPRLPAQTQATLVAAIQRLVAGEALAPSLTTLRAQLNRFAEAAAATGQNRSVGQAVGDAENIVPESLAVPAPAPETAATGVENGVENRMDPEQAAARLEPTQLPETTPPDSATGDATSDAASGAAPVSPAASLIGELRSPLLIAAGLLALVALGRLLRYPRSTPTPWQGAALALLLLPAVSEGLIRLVVMLAPSFNVPYLNILDSYSLFRNPVTQLVWAGLVILAILCLALGWRSSARTAAEKPAAPGPASRQPTAPQPPQPTPRPLVTGSTLNWDEDF